MSCEARPGSLDDRREPVGSLHVARCLRRLLDAHEQDAQGVSLGAVTPWSHACSSTCAFSDGVYDFATRGFDVRRTSATAAATGVVASPRRTLALADHWLTLLRVMPAPSLPQGRPSTAPL
jgi:hypothetical protein